MDISKARIGFKYTFEHLSVKGDVLSVEEVHNIIPDQGRDYMMGAALMAGSQLSSWFIGLYEGAHAPVAGDTMAGFVAAATEITAAYSEASRVALAPDALSNGVYVNAASPAIFTFTSEKTVRGGFISSGSVKGGTTGILLSAVLSASPKLVTAGEALRVTAGLSLITI